MRGSLRRGCQASSSSLQTCSRTVKMVEKPLGRDILGVLSRAQMGIGRGQPFFIQAQTHEIAPVPRSGGLKGNFPCMGEEGLPGQKSVPEAVIYLLHRTFLLSFRAGAVLLFALRSTN